MLAATHAVVGAMIAASVSRPELGYLLAVVSHPVLDFFPHWDLNTRYNQRTKMAILSTSLTDAAIGMGIGWWLFGSQVETTTLFITMFLAQIFDWFEAPFHLFDWHFAPFINIKRLQSWWHTKLGLPWGLVPQMAIFALAIYFAQVN